MKYLIFFMVFISQQLYAQKDEFANQSIKFVKEIIRDNKLEEALNFLNDSLVNKELLIELKNLRILLQSNPEIIHLYTVRLQAPIPLYNINLHNPNSLNEFGDFRILFHNEDDLLIDKWKFFPYEEVKEEESSYDIKNMPPPPPPPPMPE